MAQNILPERRKMRLKPKVRDSITVNGKKKKKIQTSKQPTVQTAHARRRAAPAKLPREL